MTKTIKIIGVISLIAVIGFSMAACGDDPDDGGDDPLNGVWENSETSGWKITVNGSSGTFTAMPLTSVSVRWRDAIDKDYVKLGDRYWRNIERTGELTWSGQVLVVQYYTSSPNVAVSTTWEKATFTMSKDEKTLTSKYSTIAYTWTKSTITSGEAPEKAFALTSNQWREGNVNTGSSVIWYKFPVTSGRTYNVWWNDKDDGDDTKGGDVVVRAKYGNGNYIFGSASYKTVDSGWTIPESFPASQSGTVYLEVRPYDLSSSYTGTFGIVFSTSSTRPDTSNVAPGGGSLPKGLVAKWYTDQSFANMELQAAVQHEFTADGRWLFGGLDPIDMGFITATSNKITLTDNGSIFGTANYSLSGKRLRITNSQNTAGGANFLTNGDYYKK